jgi:hypothetical protein
MAQGILPFKYEMDGQGVAMTGLGGLLAYMDLAQAMGLSRSIDKYVRVRAEGQGWTDSEVVMSLILLNLAGGECVEDLNRLEGDEGFCRVLRRVSKHGLKRKERRELERRWRKERSRGVPSPSAVFRYLEGFHDKGQSNLREEGKAFIPVGNDHLRGFSEVMKVFLGFMQKHRRQEVATLDMDATLVCTQKVDALFCYQGYKAYQPLNTWWAEQEVVVHTEFRDGNVPAGYQQLRVLKEALRLLPDGVKTVRVRSDTAGYQHDLMGYCERGKNERFGKIEFAIGADVTREFKKAVREIEESEWHPLHKEIRGQRIETGKSWAEVCFVPDAIGRSKKGPEYRYIAIREPMQEQLSFEGMEEDKNYPFQTMKLKGSKYKIFGLVTNMNWDGERLIQWHYKRCGKSEEAHSVMKEDLAGGKLPSGDFGENAAWWWIMVLSLNLNQAMKRLVLGRSWISKRMKAIRFALIHLPGRVMERSRQIFVRLPKDHPAMSWLLEIRARIGALAWSPSG